MVLRATNSSLSFFVVFLTFKKFSNQFSMYKYQGLYSMNRKLNIYYKIRIPLLEKFRKTPLMKWLIF